VVCFAQDSVILEQMIFMPGSVPGLVGRLYLDGVHVFPPAQVGPTDVIEVEIEHTGMQIELRDELHLIYAGGVEIIAVETAADRECFIDYPAIMDFGPVPVGGSDFRLGLVTNVGSNSCVIETVGVDAMTDPAFGLQSVVPTVILIDPGQTAVLLSVEFFPTREGEHRGTFMFREGEDDYFITFLGEGLEQSGGYTLNLIPNQPLAPAGGTPVAFTNPDDGFAQIGIGFPFEFDGLPVTDAWLSSNGLVAFDSAGVSSLTNMQIPSPIQPNSFIAWWWDDLRADHPQGNATVTTSLAGVPGAQVRIFTLLDMAAFGNNTPVVDVEIRLYEGSNVIEVHYGEIMDRGTDFNGSAGWESALGGEGADAFGCSPSCGVMEWPASSVLQYLPN
jgi:hypothetical protein